MPPKLCLVCGMSADEVEKMHYFPVNAEKSKLWQESMGMKHAAGVSLRNYLICNRHFTDDSYLNIVTRRLRVDAMPTLFPCRVQVDRPREEVVIVQPTNVDVDVEGEAVMHDPEPVASCSGVQRSCRSPERSRRSMFRGIEELSRVEATPRKKQLMKMVESKEAHIRKLKTLCKKRASDIKAVTNIADSSVVRNLFAGMSSETTDFLISQLRCAKRSPHGRRWTTNEKVLALALLKKSPKCYRLLRKIVALPSRSTLLAMLQKVPFNSGINQHLFNHIADTISREEDKHCVLLFDEMDIKEHVQYDRNTDRIVGFEELGEGSTQKWASKALVFMLQGVVHNWSESEQRLQYPSEPLVVAVGHAVTVLETTLDQRCCESHITDVVSNCIRTNVSFTWLLCSTHKDIVSREIVIAVCRIGIPWWCKRKSREHLQARKDARASKRKIRTFRHH